MCLCDGCNQMKPHTVWIPTAGYLCPECLANHVAKQRQEAKEPKPDQPMYGP